MNPWLQRWQGLAPREQWLGYAVALVLLGMLYMLLVGDVQTARLAKQAAGYKLAEARRLEAEAGQAALQAQLRAAPDIAYTSALLAAQANREQLVERIERNTRELVSPEKMRAVLEDLLRSQPRLRLVGLESFSEPVKLAPVEATPVAGATGVVAVEAVALYRHGVRLKLEGSYFDLLHYLQAIQGTEWKLNWDSLDYKVGEAGPGRAQISLQLYTLSRHGGWVGV